MGANAIGGMNNRYAFSGTMLFDLSNLQVKLSGSYATTESRDNTYIGNILNSLPAHTSGRQGTGSAT